MAIFRYMEFLLEERSELKGTMRISDEMRNRLKKIGDGVARGLLDLEGTDQEITYLDLGDADNTVGCMEVDKVFDHMKELGHSSGYLSRFIRAYFLPYKSHRHLEIRIGKLAKHLLGSSFSDPEYGDFVDTWRSMKTSGNFELWTGIDIQNAYSSESYEECNGSSLDNSCMNDSQYVQFYSFIEGCSVLVLLDEDMSYGPTIKGRALVWTDTEGRRVMDRVYYNYARDYRRFLEWAKDNGVWYKKRNISGGSSFVLGDPPFSHKEESLDIKVKCPNVFKYKGDGFPYMDTLCYAQGEWLSNKEPNGKYYKLQDTDGDFEAYNELEDIYGDEMQDGLDYVFSKYQNGYIYKPDAVHLKYDGGSGLQDYSLDDWFEREFVETGIPYSGNRTSFVEIDGKWYMRKHCVYSEKEGRWIWRPEAIYDKTDWISHENFIPGK